MRTIAIIAIGVIAAPCSAEQVKKVVVQQQVVQQATAVTFVPLAVQIPTYSVSYNGDYAGLIQELRGIKDEIASLRGAQSESLTPQSLTTNRCAGCHTAEVNSDKGKGVVLFEKDGKQSKLSVIEKRAVEKAVLGGTMPPGRPLPEAEKQKVVAHLKGGSQ